MNSEIHGFWTLENAKSKLHSFLQTNKINATYKFQSTGPDNQKLLLIIFKICFKLFWFLSILIILNRSFFAEMGFYVTRINKSNFADKFILRKQASNLINLNCLRNTRTWTWIDQTNSVQIVCSVTRAAAVPLWNYRSLHGRKKKKRHAKSKHPIFIFQHPK